MFPSTVFFICLLQLAKTDQSVEYYCPRGNILYGDKCIFNVSPAWGVKGEDAMKFCEIRNLVLQGNIESSWVTGGGLSSGNLCLSFDDSYHMEDCKTELPLLCTKTKDTTKPCDKGWAESASVNGKEKYCMKPSIQTYQGGPSIPVSGICPNGSTPSVIPVVPLQEGRGSFWTELYIRPDLMLKKHGKIWSPPSLLYTSGTGELVIRSKDEVLPFSCSTDAKEVVPAESQKGEGVVCEDNRDILVEGFCYKTTNRSHMLPHSTARDACRKQGYSLSNQAVPKAHYSTGWLDSVFNVSNVPNVNLRGYLWGNGSDIHLGDKDRQAFGLCLAVKTMDCEHEGFLFETKSKSGSEHCVYRTAAKGSWEEIIDRGCVGIGQSVTSRDQFEELLDGKSVDTTILPHWIGVHVDRSGSLTFNDGDKVEAKMLAPSDVKKCSSVLGGSLFLSDCSLPKPYLCTKPAKDKKGETNSNKALLAVGICLPVAVALIVLLLIFRKHGMQMCYKEPQTFDNAADNKGVIIVNPLTA